MASNASSFAAYENAHWFNQKFLTLSPECAVNTDVLIEVWCASPKNFCCGVCNLSNVSGVIQPLWQAMSSLSLVLSICMKPQECWGVLFLAIALLTSQYGTVWVLMTNQERSTAKWVAYFQFLMSMGCIPVQVALIFSPVWRQNGRSSEKMWFLKARADAHQHIHQLQPQAQRNAGADNSTSSTSASPSAASLTSASSSRARSPSPPPGSRLMHLSNKLNLPTRARRSAGQLLTQYARRPPSIRFWAGTIGLLWLVDMGVMLYFYQTKVWTGDYEFLSSECESLTASSEQGMKVASIVLVSICFILCIWQALGTVYQSFSASEIVGGFFDKRWRAKVAHDKSGKGEWALDHPWRTQAVATAVSYIGWLAVVLYYFFDALGPSGFLLAGDDPFSASQENKLIAIVPFVMSAARGYRALLFDRQKQKGLREKHHKEFQKQVEKLTRRGDPPKSLYDQLAKREPRRGRSPTRREFRGG